MIDLKKLEIWFVTGSQHLYGPEALKQVAVNSREVVQALDNAAAIPATVVFKAVVNTPDEAVGALPAGQHCRQLHRVDHLVPHVLAVQDVDQWT